MEIAATDPALCCQTLTMPKPLVEFANKPMIEHQIEALAEAGVTDVVLAVNYRPEIMENALSEVSPQQLSFLTYQYPPCPQVVLADLLPWGPGSALH